MSSLLDLNIPKLGFGLMRLPKLEDGKSIDIEQTKQMVDMFLGAGLKYFDTAYVYEGGLSEAAAKVALVERYPRDSFYLATKLNTHAQGTVDAETAKAQLATSLERTGAGYFDFYLLHALGKGNIDSYDAYGLWDFVKEAKEQGLIKHYGFSFHDTPEFLDELLTKHPDVEFVQLQINYADMEAANVQSRGCYEVARKHGKPIVVMEPVKGGTLALPPDRVTDVFKAADPDASPASWAIRYVASMEGIMVVLSGMSNVAQMADNTSFMKDFKPLSAEEQEVVRKAQEALASVEQIPCTSCRYCTPGCPMQINIPGIFSAMNTYLMYDNLEGAKRSYGWNTSNGGKGSDCIGCGQCEGECPQHISIIDWLARSAATLE